MLIPILFQLFSVLMFWRLYDQIFAARYLLRHSNKVVETVDQLRVAVNAGYYNALLQVVSRNWEAERQVDLSFDEALSFTSSLEVLTRDNPPQTERAKGIEKSFAEFRALMNELEKVSRLPSETKTSEGRANAESSLKAKSILSLFDLSAAAKKDLDQRISVFRDVERQIQVERDDWVTQVLGSTGWFVFVGFIVIVSIASFFFILFRDAISSRLQSVTSNLKKIETSQPLLPMLSGHDEIAHVDQAIHSLAAALAEKAVDTEVFLYSVSHDLRSPLVNLSGFTDELRFESARMKEELDKLELSGVNVDALKEVLDKQFEKSFHFIKNAIARLSKIIDGLLRLSRVGHVKYRNEPVDLMPIVNRVVQSLEISTLEKKASIEIKALPIVYGDESAYDQIFGNLLGNAVKYLDPSRPGLITVGTQQAEESDRILIYVKDNGLGLSEGSLKKLFLAFQRFHPEAGSGEGIGLAITRRVAGALGVKIWCESVLGQGTTFFLSLPIDPKPRLQIPGAKVGF